MAKIFGTNKKLIVGDKFDSDCELLISMPISEDDISCVDTWINEKQAKEIIEHLKYMFEL